MAQLKRKKTKDTFFPWENDLNPEQRRAIEATEGPVLVLAGAGSGKTRVIAYRVAYLIAQHIASPDRILALTFTNKAAQEMKSRIIQLIQPARAPLWIGTFHSIFARILRREAATIGFSSRFTIYDESDQLRALKDCIESNNLPTKNYTPQELINKISFLKSKLINHTAYLSYQEKNQELSAVLAPIYTAYARYLQSNNAMDFDDLLLFTYQLFENNPQVLASYQHRFKYILVDEFQDTNFVQNQILLQLAAQHQNICVVGDDDQSIYRWRGAELKNILDFEHQFPNTTIIKLEENYRSTRTILSAANSVIMNNTFRHRKELRTIRGAGEKIIIHTAETDRDEAQWITRSIEIEAHKGKWNWGDFAVLYRTNAQSRLLEDNLRRAQIPYVVVSGLKFYERKEVKDVLAYLKLIVNPDDAVSLKRIINYPPRGLGKLTISKIEQHSLTAGIPLFCALKHISEVPGIPSAKAETVLNFYNLISRYRNLRNKISPKELVSTLIDDVHIPEQIKLEHTQDAADRIRNVEELLRAIDEFAEQNEGALLEQYLAEVALLTEIDIWDNSQQYVSLMTLHSAKGLEFPVVFIAGNEEGLFPIRSAIDNPEALEEERRLFYVGATRAKDVLCLTSARVRVIYGEFINNDQSRFLNEIEPTVVYCTDKKPALTFYTPERHKKQPELIPASRLAQSSPKSPCMYSVGMFVEHEDFGRGVIKSVEDTPDGTNLRILFDNGVLKKLKAHLAHLKII